MKRVDIVGSSGIPAKYGGFETLAEYLVLSLNADYNFVVYCQSSLYQDQPKSYNGASLEYINIKANGIQSIFYDVICLLKAGSKSDIIILLGVSGSIFLPLIRLFTNVKIITNLDGIEWKREKWSFVAKLYLRFSEFLAVKFSHRIVADNLYIQKYLSTQYSAKSTFIAYGGDHSVIESLSSKVTINNTPFNLELNYAFTVCRIEPENNIHLILSAFSKSSLRYVIVGNWAASEYGKNLRREYYDFDNIYLLDPIYDLNVLNTYRSNAKLYIHGHTAGGSNPSLIEAMFMGLPCLCFDVPFNRATTFGHALYFSNEPELLDCIKTLNLETLHELGRDLHAKAIEFYKWEFIASQYDQLLKDF